MCLSVGFPGHRVILSQFLRNFLPVLHASTTNAPPTDTPQEFGFLLGNAACISSALPLQGHISVLLIRVILSRISWCNAMIQRQD